MTTVEQRSLARRHRTIAIVASVIVAVLWTVVPLSTAQGPEPIACWHAAIKKAIDSAIS